MLNPQPEVHIRGDQAARYESIGSVVYATCSGDRQDRLHRDRTASWQLTPTRKLWTRNEHGSGGLKASQT